MYWRNDEKANTSPWRVSHASRHSLYPHTSPETQKLPLYTLPKVPIPIPDGTIRPRLDPDSRRVIIVSANMAAAATIIVAQRNGNRFDDCCCEKNKLTSYKKHLPPIDMKEAAVSHQKPHRKNANQRQQDEGKENSTPLTCQTRRGGK